MPAHDSVILYLGLSDLINILSSSHDALNEGFMTTPPQYLTFTNVTLKESQEKICFEKSEALVYAKFRYNTRTQELVAKVLNPRNAHPHIISSFQWSMMLSQFTSMGVGVGDYGATLSPVITLGDWVRQPDSCLGPALKIPYTVVLGVAAAAPGSKEGLKGNVRGWIESPGNCVDLVITICINVLQPQQQMGTMTIAKWEPRGDNATNGNGNRTAMRTTVLTIKSQTSTTTGTSIDPRSGDAVPCNELRVPFETIFRRALVNLEKDVVFDQKALLKFADTTWKQIRAGRSEGY
ncbi:uncharacterized protein ASPGLDRAFT_82512, partial [Aspergillus glaucus CBS 516.65]